MAKGGLRVERADEVARALQQLAGDVEDPRSAMTAIAEEMAANVAASAPRRSGRLAASWRATTTKARAVVESTVPYAGPINYGWPARNIAASGFVQRADQSSTPSATQRLEDDINASIRRRGLT